MASGEELLDKIRESHSGHKQGDFRRLLESYGFVFLRHARHGAIFRHPELTEHPDLDVRKSLAHVMVPKGDDLRPYVARKVLASIDALFDLRGRTDDGEEKE